MNPLFVVPLLAYTLAATLWPGQVDGRRRGRALLFGEALFVIAALVLGTLLAPLARPSADGLWWGRVGLLATAYLYVSGRGIVLVRSVLELPTLQMRRDEDRTAGAIDVARGRAVGSLERALALTMVLLGDYAAVGWIIAAKSLARFKQLEDREFAEYFLVGTLASFLLASLLPALVAIESAAAGSAVPTTSARAAISTVHRIGDRTTHLLVGPTTKPSASGAGGPRGPRPGAHGDRARDSRQCRLTV